LLECVLDVFITILLVGWDCGYASYLFALVTASFYFTFVNRGKEKAYHSLPLVLSLLMILCFFINYCLKTFVPPLTPLTSVFFSSVIFVFNTTIAFGAMIVFSYLFVWELNSRQQVLEESNAKLEELAHKDPLTRLLNRRSMNEILTGHMETLKRSGKRFTVILGDIDDFKKINDTYGHDAGDLVLVRVADTIRESTGEDDAVCRWGGEEILILINAPLEMAAVTAENIRRNIENMNTQFEDKEIRVTMTFGIAESIPGYRLEHLIQQADDKLYFGKKHGKNQVVTDIKKS
ncbi:MAG: GGDEF domain-containing protein, partial [Lachnospiraceae bacterium]|nr:GGDEF domain-containing protein [Lachnospiraceae bacterium]